MALSEEAQALELRIETLEELAEGYEGYQSGGEGSPDLCQGADYMHGVYDVVAKLIDVPTELMKPRWIWRWARRRSIL